MRIIISSILVFLILLFYSPVKSSDKTVAFLPQAYPIEATGGTGFINSTNSNVASMNSSNPASLYDFDTMSLGFSYQFESKIDPAWVVDIKHKRYQNKLPQSLSIVYPLKNMRIALGMNQRYNSIMSIEEVEIRTIENPEGTGETITAIDTTTILCYSGLFSYSFQNILSKNDRLHLGFQYNFNRLNAEESIYHLSINYHDNSSSWAVGIRYDIPTKVKLGLFYEQGSSFHDQESIKADSLIISDFDPTEYGHNDPIIATLDTRLSISAKLPGKLHGGVLFYPYTRFTVTFDMTKIYWHQLPGNSKDQIDISGNILYEANKYVTLSCGFLSTDRKYSEEANQGFGLNGKFNCLFFHGGITVHLSHFDVGFAYTKTSSGSGAWCKQTIKNLSLNYRL